MYRSGRLLAPMLCLLLATSGGAQSPAGRDPLLAQVDELLGQARREIREFEQGGGKHEDARHPVVGWVERLWEVRERHPGTPAAGRATAEAIHLLVHADRVAEAETRADGLAPDDPAWESLGGVLFEAASIRKDYGFLIRKLGSLVEQQRGPKVRAGLRYHLGRAHSKRGEREAARAALKAVLQELPGSSVAKEAETALYELESLGYGQPAPAFTSGARGGSRQSLADLRGKVVLLVFWAST